MELFNLLIDFAIILGFYYFLVILRWLLQTLFGVTGNQICEKKVMIVFGSGGHTTEMLMMIKSMEFKTYVEVFFVIGHSDTWSLTKIQDFFLKNRNLNIEKGDIKNLSIIKVFRSREVK